MPRRPTRRASALATGLTAFLLAVPTGDAAAGEFQVATCQADSLTFTTRPFDDFATRGMKIKRACNPEGPGLRGLITANAVRRGSVPRGARAIVAINAPAGTRFTSLRWAGTARRGDCRYALQLYADAPDMDAVPIKNVRANQRCPRHGRAQAAGYRSRTYNVSGATQIVQRVICVGAPRRKSCSARGANFIRTYKAAVGIADSLPPGVAIMQDTPLARGEWVRGAQPLNYDASDNVGVRMAQALVSGRTAGSHQRTCLYATTQGAYAERVPCANGPGQIGVDTTGLPEGTHPLVVQAQDSAGNVADSGALTARIDNAPPARVDVAAAGGEGWRNQNTWTIAWANPPEGDRAPIASANYKLCPARGGSCRRGQQIGSNLSRLATTVPAPGEWKLSVWRRDAAGNESESNASVPVVLRYDPEPPQLTFEPSPATDPTVVGVSVTDKVSGLASGSIEISPAGSGTWQSLATQRDGSRLIARIDDATLPAGTYALRARAYDQARNESSTDHRADGQPMVVNLPLRVAATIQAGVEHTRLVRRTVRRGGKRRVVRRPTTVLKPVSKVMFGRRVQLAGRLANRDGNGIAGAGIQVLSRTETSPEQLVAVLQTDAEGGFRYTATGSSTRTLRLVYGGSPLVLPAQSEVKLHVPAASSMRVTRWRVLNGQAVTFTGQMRGLPVPPGGKLVELQVHLSGRWQTFRTVRSDAAGRWAIRYRFLRTRGVQRFRFRARLPGEAGYPFETGVSRSIKVRVRGV